MKILYVTTIGITMHFFDKLIYGLLEKGHTVDIICNEQNSRVPECYREWGCNVYHHTCMRSPFAKGNIEAISQIRELVKKNKYDIVHCHTPVAAACTRLACRKIRKNSKLKVIYTAHGFHFYKGAPLKNWAVFYSIEKICSYFTDMIITINHEDYELAKRKMKANYVEYVPGVGVDVEKFKNTIVNKVEKRKILGVPEDSFLLVSVGELNENKNHKVIIEAMSMIEEEDIHYVIAGVGSQKDYLIELAKSFNIEERVHLLGYRNDIAELYKASDVCCFPSIREGLPVALMEAVATGVPVVAAENRGSREIIVHGENGYLCKYNAADCFKKYIREIKQKNVLSSSDSINGFDINTINKKMELIYGAFK